MAQIKEDYVDNVADIVGAAWLNPVAVIINNIDDSSITFNYSQISDFQTGVSANSDVTTNSAKQGVTTEISDVVEDTTPTLGGDLDYNSNGTTITGQTVGGADGEVVYLSGSNTWSQADASAEATCKDALGIRVSASIVLTQGVFTTTGLTAGSLYYVSETAGAITATAPATSLSIVRPIAYALTTTELYVFPSGSYVEVA